MKTTPIVIETILNAPVEIIWQAITDNSRMKQWYFDIADFRPEVGFEFQFEGQNEGRTFTHQCIVKEVQLNQKISYSWAYEGYEGQSLVLSNWSAKGFRSSFSSHTKDWKHFQRGIPILRRITLFKVGHTSLAHHCRNMLKTPIDFPL